MLLLLAAAFAGAAGYVQACGRLAGRCSPSSDRVLLPEQRQFTYAVRAARRNASRSTAASGTIYKRKIYRLFTHLGHRNLISRRT